MNDGCPLTIGRLAKAAGVIVETIRYYQRIGLHEEPEKPLNGFRHYPQDTVERVRLIKRAQQLGFSLKEIGELLALDSGRWQGVPYDERRRHSLAPERLELEITESVAMAREGPAIASLQALKRLGVKLSIDDFGTGYSYGCDEVQEFLLGPPVRPETMLGKLKRWAPRVAL